MKTIAQGSDTTVMPRSTIDGYINKKTSTFLKANSRHKPAAF